MSVFIKRVYHYLMACSLLFALPVHAQDSNSGSAPTFYELKPGDTVRVAVFNEADLTAAQELDPDGEVILPLLGRVTLGGMKLREAETKLEQLFISEEYLISPQVTVTISKYADEVFYIFGEVNSPGAKTFPAGKQSLDILEAITMGGDLTQYAKRSELLIRRPIEGEDREEKIEVNLDRILRGNNNQDSVELIRIYPDDIVFVPERLF